MFHRHLGKPLAIHPMEKRRMERCQMEVHPKVELLRAVRLMEKFPTAVHSMGKRPAAMQLTRMYLNTIYPMALC